MASFFRPLPFAAKRRLTPSRIACAIGGSLLPYLLAAGAHGASARFAPISIYPSGGAPQYTATADINSDGKEDIFASNLNGVISVLLGNGNGSFQPPKTIAALAAGSYPILTADFNRDGKPDLAVLERGSARVLIYLGRGDGSFEAPRTFLAGKSPQYMAVGDVNGDHNADLIVSSGTPNSSPAPVGFNLLLGDGKGNVHAPVMVTAKNGVAGGLLTVGDVNNDGHLDVVTGDQSGNVEVFLGNGSGTFREQSPFIDGTSSGAESQFLLADLYGNGKLDLVVGNFGFQGFSGGLVVLQGNGDGTFSNGTSYTAGFLPAWLAAADMNSDGKMDLVVGNAFSNSVTVLLNRGAGTFTSSPNNYATAYLQTDLSTPTPGLLSVADFNGDGKPDVALASIVGVDVLLNIRSGALYAPASVEVGQLTGQIFATDFNGDGHADLAVATSGQVGIAVGTVEVLFANGGGSFTKTPFLVEDPAGIATLAGGYFNGSGQPGIAAYGYANQGLYQIYNQGKGSLTNGPSLTLPNQPPFLCAGDFNRDGYSDFAVLDGNEVDIYLNKHDGSYSGPVSYKLGLNPGFILTRDLNGDGKPDLVATNSGSNDVSVLLGKGDGTFGAARSYPAGSHPNVVTTGDFNRDGKIDLAVGGSQATILLGRGDGSFATPSTYPAHGPVTYIAQASLRGNGVEDLLAVSTDFSGNAVPTNIYLLTGKGDGSFASPVSYGGGANPYWLAIADFNGDGAQDIAVSDFYSSALTLLLNQRGTRIALKSSSALVKVGQTVTFTASLSASVPPSGQPVGIVAFKDGATILGTAHLANGKAVFATANLSQGTHIITASYWGDVAFNPHVSPSTAVKVNH